MITTDDVSHKQEVAEAVAEAIRDGDYVERMTVDEGRAALSRFCRCNETEAEAAERLGQQRLFEGAES